MVVYGEVHMFGENPPMLIVDTGDRLETFPSFITVHAGVCKKHSGEENHWEEFWEHQSRG